MRGHWFGMRFRLVAGAGVGCKLGCDHALDNAVITQPAFRDAALMQKLDAVMGRSPA